VVAPETDHESFESWIEVIRKDIIEQVMAATYTTIVYDSNLDNFQSHNFVCDIKMDRMVGPKFQHVIDKRLSRIGDETALERWIYPDECRSDCSMCAVISVQDNDDNVDK